jgi:hypothetical protein
MRAQECLSLALIITKSYIKEVGLMKQVVLYIEGVVRKRKPCIVPVPGEDGVVQVVVEDYTENIIVNSETVANGAKFSAVDLENGLEITVDGVTVVVDAEDVYEPTVEPTPIPVDEHEYKFSTSFLNGANLDCGVLGDN